MSDAPLELTATIVAAYVSKNTLAPADLPALLKTIYQQLTTLGQPAPEIEAPAALVPAVSVRRSVTPDHIVCLEDGKKLKMLKRHLRTAYNLSPDEYRAKWGLPSDYPMVAPNYAAQRSDLAKSIGLGKRAEPTAVEPAPAKARRGRKAA
ncbi:MucR family transcriptional regulator [Nitrospirillum iridis]|uniref:Putative transcriptional regulator n=1 Tax=Nitrospirillum iridis TaxID=765888 RepID=A0A7X0B385_9PROT|nr:MucR family transcriptional regulator [Nitrospirillum iridis]MBB6254552.1 putative transcriptional regulator [Nitrospirillum iridis]